MHETNKTITSTRYLKYGYYWPDSALSREPVWLQRRYQDRFKHARYTEKEVGELLRQILRTHLEELAPGARCVIPLSGGFDSRLLLGEALHQLASSQIRTVTFGNPGQLDFYLGRRTAQAVGVENIAVELNSVPISWDALIDSARRSPWTYLPDVFFNEHARLVAAGSNDIILSGFMGGATTGGHLFTGVKEQVIADFFRRQLRGSSTYHRVRKHVLEAPRLDSLPSIVEEAETMGLYLDLEIRQRYGIAPITTGVQEVERWDCSIGRCQVTGAKVKAPFAAPEWIAYWRDAPTAQKRKQWLYRSLISKAHPVLDRVGKKEFLGARSRRSAQYLAMFLWLGSKFMVDRLQDRKTFFREKLNYVDYREKLRHADDYRAILHRSAETLLDAELIAESGYEHNVLTAPGCIDPETSLVLIGCAANVAVHGR